MSQKKILYVDDDPDLRSVVRNELQQQGYLLDEASNGDEAVRKLEAGNYDVMLLDINMPGKSGIEVLKFAREKALPCRTIMLTGRLGFSIATESLKLGADDYITKPFTIDYLLFSIKKALSGDPKSQ